MPKTVTSLTGVRTKSGASAKGPWTLTIFSAADGREYSTFDGALASKANSLLNQPLEIEYSPGNDPVKYPNSYTLHGAETTSGDWGVVTNSPLDGAANTGQFPLETTPLAPVGNKNDQFRTKEQIMRTDALNAALTLFGIIGLDPLSSSDEFYGWYQSLYGLIEAGIFEWPSSGIFETPDVGVEA